LAAPSKYLDVKNFREADCNTDAVCYCGNYGSLTVGVRLTGNVEYYDIKEGKFSGR